MRRQLEWLDSLRRAWSIVPFWINDSPMVNFLKHRVRQSRWVKLVGRTLLKWQQDDCLEMGGSPGLLRGLFPVSHDIGFP